MNWHAVWTHVVAGLESDEEVGLILGTGEQSRFFMAGDRPVTIPSMTAMLVVDTEDEVFAPFEMQFDIYAKTLEEVVRLEQAFRRLLNQPLPVTMGDAVFTAEFLSGQLLRGPLTDPHFRRQLDFRFTPVRSRYYRPQPVGG